MTLRLSTVPLNRGSQRRPTRAEPLHIARYFVQFFRGVVAGADFRQLNPSAQLWMRPTQSGDYHSQPIAKQPRRNPAISRQLFHRRSGTSVSGSMNLGPQYHRQNHAIHRVRVIRSKLVRKQRECPFHRPTLKSRYRNHPLAIWKQPHRAAHIWRNPTAAPPISAKRTLPPQNRLPVDFSHSKCFFVFEHRRKAVIVHKLDSLHPAPGRFQLLSGISQLKRYRSVLSCTPRTTLR